MLEPDDRTLLSDALRPPDGFDVDIAVGTTYTLDIESLLLAPMAMAAYEYSSADFKSVNPLALLESIRRYAGRLTVFVQAGGIHVPATYPRLATFAEDSVVEILPPDRHVFHPKVWVLRFQDSSGEIRHRFICLSRNLTFDRSWDTVLVLDENPDAVHTVDSAPISQFLRGLLDMERTGGELAKGRAAQIASLTSTLEGARLQLPQPFTAGSVLPLGGAFSGTWPLPEDVDDLVVISPFLDATAVARLPRANQSMLISRGETFDRLPREQLTDRGSVWVLQESADAVEPTQSEEQADEQSGPQEATRGLHAKVFGWNDGMTGFVLTGSANCTSAAFAGNIECSVLLEGPKRSVGIAGLFDDKSEMRRLLMPYSPAASNPTAEAEYAMDREIEQFHIAVAAAGLVMRVDAADDQLSLSLDWPAGVSPIGSTSVRPASLSPTRSRDLQDDVLRWDGVTLQMIVPYVVVETTLTSDTTVVTRARMLRVELIGDPTDRADRIFGDLLARGEDLLRYLALLLGDPTIADIFGDDLESAGEGAKTGASTIPGFEDVVLLEPLLRAAARNDGSLERMDKELTTLKRVETGDKELGDDFWELWRAVWESTRDA